MNLLMLIIIFLAVWVAGAICYFAWRLTPDVPGPEDRKESGAAEPPPGPERDD